MNEPTHNNSIDTDPLVPPPHFDDEQTVQFARPVVPLEQINGKVRQRRRWVLGGAFAIAMILGAASALVASYLKLRNAATPVAEVEVTPEPEVVAESVPAESPVIEEAKTEQPVPVESPKKAAPPVKRDPVAERIDELYRPSPRRRVNEDEDLDRVRDAVLYDEWQERRARRAERRERRRQERDHRDLSNLDEIFEGRRRRATRDPD